MKSQGRTMLSPTVGRIVHYVLSSPLQAGKCAALLVTSLEERDNDCIVSGYVFLEPDPYASGLRLVPGETWLTLVPSLAFASSVCFDQDGLKPNTWHYPAAPCSSK